MSREKNNLIPISAGDLEKHALEILDFDRKIYPLKFGKRVSKQRLIIPLHWQNKETLESVVFLAKKNKSPDISILTRSIFESVVTEGVILNLPVRCVLTGKFDPDFHPILTPVSPCYFLEFVRNMEL